MSALAGPAAYTEHIAEVLLTEEQIAGKVAELAAEVSRDYAERPLVVVGVLNGSAVFLSDLLRRLTVPATVEFVGASSYCDGTVSRGACELTKDLDRPIEGIHALVVEDIVDTGRTLAALAECLRAKGAASVEVCVLLDKPSRRAVEFHPRYVGFEIPDRFVVGYGLDFAQHYRGLPYVAVLKPEAYESPTQE
ncbi:MAG: hypoxanthine phosphoribosyltransferase [Armatimonadetes bacterium]|nr:hypoxanthine phosphoribosyltransferase [Armatimonadota bacterium]